MLRLSPHGVARLVGFTPRISSTHTSTYTPVLSLRTFGSTPPFLAKNLPPRRIILDSEIEENFLKGSGPGGQKINKTSSAVQLKHLPSGIVVKCQETRSRSQNRKIARRILGERIEEVELGEGSRTAMKARERSRKKASADKKKRRKYKSLAEEKEGEQEGVVVEADASGDILEQDKDGDIKAG